VLPSTNMYAAHVIAERLRKAIASKSFSVGLPQNIPITVSIGVATLLHAEDSLERLLKRADLALYEAKREGRNRVVEAAA
jgi:two-component system, cell cycle response regulator